MPESEDRTATAVIVEEQLTFTLTALCRASGAEPSWVQARVGDGLLRPTGLSPADWCFRGDALAQTRRALRLARDLELDGHGIAVVMDLLVEIERLRARLRRR